MSFSLQGCDTHNTGMTLIKGAVMLVMYSYMFINVEEVPGQGDVGASWRQGG